MSCLKSFNFNANANSNFTGAQVKTWSTVGGPQYWVINTGLLSTFNIQGFKNVNIHKFEVIGNVQTLVGAPNGGVIVEDWDWIIFLNGQQPLISGNITASPNQFNIGLGPVIGNTYEIGKYSPCVTLSSPIESVKSIQIQSLKAQGYGGETAGNVNVSWDVQFIFHYTYEGEEY